MSHSPIYQSPANSPRCSSRSRTPSPNPWGGEYRYSTPPMNINGPDEPSTPVKQQRRKQQTRPPPPPMSEFPVTRTSAIHIPRWASGYVFGGRELRHLKHICKKHGNLVTHVQYGQHSWTSFKQPNGQIFAVLTLIGYGPAEKVENAMKNVKNDLMRTLGKAKHLKSTGQWKDRQSKQGGGARKNYR